MNKDSPTNAAVLERAHSFANEAMWTVALQHRRIQSPDPADRDFIFRRWTDFQFLIVALWRLRRAAELAANVTSVEPALRRALQDFDTALPVLRTMRNVAEHFDEYALDSGHLRSIDRRQLQVVIGDGLGGGKNFQWLGRNINIDDALRTGEKLYLALQTAMKSYRPERAD
jgi:hypothetical protein